MNFCSYRKNPICYDLPVFATIHDCSPLFALFETIRTIPTVRYSGVFAFDYSRLFAIWVFQTPQMSVAGSIVREWVPTASFLVGTGTSEFQNAGRVCTFSTRDKAL